MSRRDRDRSTIIALGGTGTGKTLLTRLLITAWLDSFKREFPAWKGRYPIFIADPNCGFPAPYGEFPDEAHEDTTAMFPWIREITGHGHGPSRSSRVTSAGGLLVLDDADTYIQNTNAINPWRPLWTKNRHLRLDIIVSAHRPQGIPKEMFAVANLVYCFQMEEPNAVSWLESIPILKNVQFELPEVRFMALKIPLRPRGTPVVQRLFNEPGGNKKGK
jgi:hypothetical protein